MNTHHAEYSPRDRTELLYTVDDLAATFRTTRWTVYRLVRDGDIKAVRVGERLRFRQADVDAYLERGRESG